MLYDVSTRELCFVIFATAILHNVYRPETAKSTMRPATVTVSDADGDEGDGEGDDRQQNNRNDGMLARYNLMRAIFLYE